MLGVFLHLLSALPGQLWGRPLLLPRPRGSDGVPERAELGGGGGGGPAGWHVEEVPRGQGKGRGEPAGTAQHINTTSTTTTANNKNNIAIDILFDTY